MAGRCESGVAGGIVGQKTGRPRRVGCTFNTECAGSHIRSYNGFSLVEGIHRFCLQLVGHVSRLGNVNFFDNAESETSGRRHANATSAHARLVSNKATCIAVGAWLVNARVTINYQTPTLRYVNIGPDKHDAVLPDTEGPQQQCGLGLCVPARRRITRRAG